MLISVLINNYNYGRFLGEAIESVLIQDDDRYEVIVVDDGSTDGSRGVIAGFGDRITPVLKSNGGQASAFNAGFAASRGEVVALLDSDDRFLPGKLAAVRRTFTERPEVDWFFHEVSLFGDRTGAPARARPYGLVDQRRQFAHGRPSARFPATSGLSFRRSLLDQLLPMPVGEGVSIGDHYLKFGAGALALGWMSHERLAAQRIHGQNIYTDRRHETLEARIYLKTAAALRDKAPGARAFADNLVGTAEAIVGGRLDVALASEIKRYIALGGGLTRWRVLFWRVAKGLLRQRHRRGADHE